jgi:hypothetical protein
VAVPAPHPWRTEGKGLDEVARRALLAFVSAPQVLLDSGVGGAGVDEAQGGAAALGPKGRAPSVDGLSIYTAQAACTSPAAIC